jgi:hypothetical protein
MSVRKPHSINAGYVSERKMKDGTGHVVIYDTQNGFDLDGEDRWIVMHEPSSIHVSVPSKAKAYEVMKDTAEHGIEIIGDSDDPIWLETLEEMKQTHKCEVCGRTAKYQLGDTLYWVCGTCYRKIQNIQQGGQE